MSFSRREYGLYSTTTMGVVKLLFCATLYTMPLGELKNYYVES